MTIPKTIKILITGNESKIIDLDQKKTWPKDAIFVTSKKRRRYKTDTTTVVRDYERTALMRAKTIKDNGGIKPDQVLYRVVSLEKDEYVNPVISVPEFRGQTISGRNLKIWKEKMDKKYPLGYETKGNALDDDATPIIDLLEAKGAMTHSEIKKFEEVDDFDE